MGNLETLGWAIIKGYTVPATERVQFVKEMKRLMEGFSLKSHKWMPIQRANVNVKAMQFDSLVNCDLDEEMFKAKQDGQPQRRMYYQMKDGHGKKMKTDHPIFYDIFEHNLIQCKDYVRYETSIKSQFHFWGHNILGNYKGIREQYIHTDYPKGDENKNDED